MTDQPRITPNRDHEGTEVTDAPDSRRRALAFNAVGPAVNAAGCWLPLSARRALAWALHNWNAR